MEIKDPGNTGLEYDAELTTAVTTGAVAVWANIVAELKIATNAKRYAMDTYLSNFSANIRNADNIRDKLLPARSTCVARTHF